MLSSILDSDSSCDPLATKFVEGISMASKRSPTNRAAEPARTDDLKLINGIGPAVEKRLHGGGIFTFPQLAALSPADIAAAVADLAGLSAERIVKQDWIGQARRLAEESTSSEAPKELEPAAEPPAPLEHPHVATPLVEPHHTRELVPETISSEVQEKVEASTDIQHIITFTAPVEPAAPVKRAPATARSVEPEKVTMSSIERYHPATFTVELQLDENNQVYRTHVLHVQSRREYTWSDWPGAELVDFLGQSAGVKFASDEPVLANAEEPEQAPALVTYIKPPTSTTAKPALAGTLHLRDMKVLTVGSSEPRRLLPHDQPFDVRLTLDLSEITVPGNTPLNYKASIYRKSRSDPSGQIIGEAEGTIKPDVNVTIDVEGNFLVVGSYRLAVKVILALPDTKPASKPDIMAVIDGYRIRVF
jgi:predicted flap endonuclease-1-like 5' DNA nuclease